MRNLLFYKYVELNDLETFQAEHLKLLLSLGMKGKILIAHEGINGCITGTDEAAASYKEKMHADSRFADLEFKDTYAAEHTFRKTIVRIKQEIVASRTTVSVHNRAPYIEPDQLKEELDANKPLLLLDARNNYESAIGRFANALTPNLEVFREFSDYAATLDVPKDQPIVTYCTGGIRCEKASAILREHGFTNVRQLHGGIIRYGEVAGPKHWEGKCFVFDTRVAIPIHESQDMTPITRCVGCGKPADIYANCALYACDKRFIACAACSEHFSHCCSAACAAKLDSQPSHKPRVTRLTSCAL